MHHINLHSDWFHKTPSNMVDLKKKFGITMTSENVDTLRVKIVTSRIQYSFKKVILYGHTGNHKMPAF